MDLMIANEVIALKVFQVLKDTLESCLGLSATMQVSPTRRILSEKENRLFNSIEVFVAKVHSHINKEL